MVAAFIEHGNEMVIPPIDHSPNAVAPTSDAEMETTVHAEKTGQISIFSSFPHR